MQRRSIASVLAFVLLGGVSQAQVAPDNKRDCFQMNDFDLKIRACAQWLGTPGISSGDRASGLIERGIGWRRKGDMETAIAHYNEAIKLKPDSSLAFNNRGVAFEKKGDLDRAIADYDQALRLKATNTFALVNRGNVHKMKGLWTKAVADYTAGIQHGSKNPQVFFDRGLSFLNLGDNDRAIADFDVAIRQLPANAALFVNRGVALHRKKDLTRALADFREAARLAPDFALAKQNLAAVTDELGRITVAKPVLKPLPRVGETLIASANPNAVQTQLGAPGQPTVALPLAGTETRVALVIGNAAYTGVSPLRNSTNDAAAVASKLREVGFTKVTTVTDVSREAMIKALAAFSRDAEAADWAVVYYAGHGMQIGGTNWLIPTDATLKTDRDAQFQAVSVDQVIAAVDGAKRLRLVVLDACRDNPFAAQMRITNGATRAIGRGLGRMEPSSTLVAFAAKDGQTALDGSGQNSPFAEALVRNLGTPGLELNRLFRRVAAEVLRTTGNEQEPLTYGRLPDEDLFFVAPKTRNGVAAPATPAAPAKAS